MVPSFPDYNITYVALAFLPPLIWLFFYLQEDRHPEPKALILSTFIGGIIAAIGAIFAECAFFLVLTRNSCENPDIFFLVNPLILFAGISLIEEYAKYLAVKFIALRNKNFDEPIDAMIYMMTAAMGFAAFENQLFLIFTPLFRDNFFAGLTLTASRFLGANLLHALSSGILGFFLARAWFHPRRHHFIFLGAIIAGILHTIFNYLILIRDDLEQGILYVVLLLAIMTIVVLIEFQRLKHQEPQTILKS